MVEIWVHHSHLVLMVQVVVEVLVVISPSPNLVSHWQLALIQLVLDQVELVRITAQPAQLP